MASYNLFKSQKLVDNMCGIVGTASVNFVKDTEWLSIGRDSMLHRGPDDAGEFWSKDGRVGLAHRRLSVLEISHLGHQPMHLPGYGLSIVFNGEIYNCSELRVELERIGNVFRSSSDTEVLLFAYKQWGKDFLSKVNGMFSFAIFDSIGQTVFLARDRVGEKPLFYYLSNGELFFSSELKALLKNVNLPRQVDLESLDCYLSMGYVPGDKCILEGYKKLPPAHAMEFNIINGDLKIWRYWDLPILESNLDIYPEELMLYEFEGLFEDAVKKQLSADVPVGVLLSGGLDSSLVTAMAVRCSTKRVKTFTVGFPGHAKNDETAYARYIAGYFGTDHMELMAEPASVDLIPALAAQFDEPIVDSSMIPTSLVSNLVRQHCTVAIGGDGGDELFGGYEHYSRLLWMKHHLGAIPPQVAGFAGTVAERFLPIGAKGRNYLQSLGADLRKDLPQLSRHFDPSCRKKLMRNIKGYKVVAESVYQSLVFSSDDLLERSTKTDFISYLPEDILVKVDRASMLNSLEIRSPFLDKRVVEYAYKRIPSHLKANTNSRKLFLKKIAGRILPKEFNINRKQGFSIPMSEWLKSGPYHDFFHDVLYASDCIFDKEIIDELWFAQMQGCNNGERLYSLVMFELWRKIYNISI